MWWVSMVDMDFMTDRQSITSRTLQEMTKRIIRDIPCIGEEWTFIQLAHACSELAKTNLHYPLGMNDA